MTKTKSKMKDAPMSKVWGGWNAMRKAKIIKRVPAQDVTNRDANQVARVVPTPVVCPISSPPNVALSNQPMLVSTPECNRHGDECMTLMRMQTSKDLANLGGTVSSIVGKYLLENAEAHEAFIKRNERRSSLPLPCPRQLYLHEPTSSNAATEVTATLPELTFLNKAAEATAPTTGAAFLPSNA